MRLQFTTALVALGYLFSAVDAKQIWKPKQGDTWNYILEDEGFNLAKEKAHILDMDVNTKQATINKIHKANKKIICYFSGGTIESHRKDKQQYKKVKGLVRNRYENWKDEYWLDIRKNELKPLITNRMKEAIKKGCDALEVDNLDAYDFPEVKNWKPRLTKQDEINFAIWLAKTAHSLGISIGLKNGLFMINEVGKYFDFAINESCVTLGTPECHLYRNFLKQGKAVFGVTYNGMKRYQNRLCQYVANNNLNISMIVKEGWDLVQSGTTFNPSVHCKSNAKKSSAKKTTQKKNNKKKTTKKTTKKPVAAKKTTKKQVAQKNNNKKVVTKNNVKKVTQKNVNKKTTKKVVNNKNTKKVNNKKANTKKANTKKTNNKKSNNKKSNNKKKN
ncbi:hypothetical protein PIROE2DRAFT_67164 [Piromyces sp. E2]|nr:hypothetical protein PIROE2DRAFT_67164 [Piromyces sp. E2]|eukprot:OUM65824.1 hypothetical protein PIROE2DRAFT_67164 [Piromyces sp. E2]